MWTASVGFCIFVLLASVGYFLCVWVVLLLGASRPFWLAHQPRGAKHAGMSPKLPPRQSSRDVSQQNTKQQKTQVGFWTAVSSGLCCFRFGRCLCFGVFRENHGLDRSNMSGSSKTIKNNKRPSDTKGHGNVLQATRELSVFLCDAFRRLLPCLVQSLRAPLIRSAQQSTHSIQGVLPLAPGPPGMN